jgi:hypothetical protein
MKPENLMISKNTLIVFMARRKNRRPIASFALVATLGSGLVFEDLDGMTLWAKDSSYCVTSDYVYDDESSMVPTFTGDGVEMTGSDWYNGEEITCTETTLDPTELTYADAYTYLTAAEYDTECLFEMYECDINNEENYFNMVGGEHVGW